MKPRRLSKNRGKSTNFGLILESKKAVEYLERSERPSFETAFRLAGGDEPGLVKLIERAADDIEAALSRVHLYVKSKKVQQAVARVGQDAIQLLKIFPDIQNAVMKET